MLEETFFGTDPLISANGIKIGNFNVGKTNSKISQKNTLEDLKREYVFTIELGNSISEVAIDTKAVFIKGDKNTSLLKASIVKNGQAVDITGYTVTANIKEGSRSNVTVVCEIESAADGLININLPHNLVDERGTSLFEISLQKEDKIVVSQQYKYTVLNSLGEGVAGEETQLTALQSLIQQVQQSKVLVDDITTELEVTQSDIDEILGMVGGLGD